MWSLLFLIMLIFIKFVWICISKFSCNSSKFFLRLPSALVIKGILSKFSMLCVETEVSLFYWLDNYFFFYAHGTFHNYSWVLVLVLHTMLMSIFSGWISSVIPMSCDCPFLWHYPLYTDHAFFHVCTSTICLLVIFFWLYLPTQHTWKVVKIHLHGLHIIQTYFPHFQHCFHIPWNITIVM